MACQNKTLALIAAGDLDPCEMSYAEIIEAYKCADARDRQVLDALLSRCCASGEGPCVCTDLPAPDNLAVAPNCSENELDITWDDNSTDETDFELQRSLGPGPIPTSWTVPATLLPADSTSLTDTLLEADTQYFYRIRAIRRTEGCPTEVSAWSDVADGTTAELGAPDNFVATPAGADQIDLTWDDNSANETGFEIQRSLDGVGGWATVLTPAANATSDSDTGLSPTTEYFYRIRATGAFGAISCWSDVTSATTDEVEYDEAFFIGEASGWFDLDPDTILTDACARFEDSMSERLQITDASQTGLDGFGVNPEFTITAFVKVKTGWSGGSPFFIIRKADFGAPAELSYYLTITPALNVNLRIYDAADGVSTEDAVGATTLLEDTWYHIAATFSDNDERMMRVFVNGVEDGNNQSAFSEINHGTAAFQIGNGAEDCAVSSVGFWGTRALPESEILDLYNALVPERRSQIDPSILVGITSYWPLNEPGGITRADSQRLNDLADDGGGPTKTDTGLVEYVAPIGAGVTKWVNQAGGGTLIGDLLSDIGTTFSDLASPQPLIGEREACGVLFREGRMFTATGALTQPVTLVIVATLNTHPAASGTLLDGEDVAGNRAKITVDNTGLISADAGTALAGSILATSTRGKIVAVYSGASSKLRVNGVEATGDAGLDDLDGLSVGSDSDLLIPADALVEHISVYDRELSGAEITALEGLLLQPAAPAAPSGLTATQAGQTLMTLAWTDNSTNEAGFELERSLDGVGGWVNIAVLLPGETGFTDAGLTESTQYFYRVRAVNCGGNSAYSAIADDTTAVGVAPDPPSNLVATAISDTEIDLTWDDNSLDETGFELERSPDGVGSWVQISTPGINENADSDTGLTAATQYFYRIRAVNGFGNSAYSNIADDTTDAAPDILEDLRLEALAFYEPVASSRYTNNGSWFVASSSEALSITNAAQVGLSPGATSFSISIWVKATADATQRTIVGKWTEAGNLREYRIIKNTSNQFVFQVSSDGTAVTAATFTATVADNGWHHIVAWVNDGVDINITVDDGTPITTAFAASVNASTATFRIGSRDSAEFYQGGAMDFAIWAGALTSGDITELYNGSARMAEAGLSGSLAAKLGKWFTLGEPGNKDRKASDGTNVLTEAGSVTEIQRRHIARSYLRASSQYFSNADAGGDLNPGTSFSVVVWCKCENDGAASPICGKWNGSGRSWVLSKEGDNLLYFLWDTDGAAGGAASVTKVNISGSNLWKMVAGVWDGANIRISLNGGAFASALAGTAAFASTEAFEVARYGGSTYGQGSVARVMIWNNRALTQQELAQLWARSYNPTNDAGTGHALPTIPYLFENGLVAHWDFTNSSGVTPDLVGSLDLTANNSPGIELDGLIPRDYIIAPTGAMVTRWANNTSLVDVNNFGDLEYLWNRPGPSANADGTLDFSGSASWLTTLQGFLDSPDNLGDSVTVAVVCNTPTISGTQAIFDGWSEATLPGTTGRIGLSLVGGGTDHDMPTNAGTYLFSENPTTGRHFYIMEFAQLVANTKLNRDGIELTRVTDGNPSAQMYGLILGADYALSNLFSASFVTTMERMLIVPRSLTPTEKSDLITALT